MLTRCFGFYHILAIRSLKDRSSTKDDIIIIKDRRLPGCNIPLWSVKYHLYLVSRERRHHGCCLSCWYNVFLPSPEKAQKEPFH